jgi:hypothetical protein
LEAHDLAEWFSAGWSDATSSIEGLCRAAGCLYNNNEWVVFDVCSSSAGNDEWLRAAVWFVTASLFERCRSAVWFCTAV